MEMVPLIIGFLILVTEMCMKKSFIRLRPIVGQIVKECADHNKRAYLNHSCKGKY